MQAEKFGGGDNEKEESRRRRRRGYFVSKDVRHIF